MHTLEWNSGLKQIKGFTDSLMHLHSGTEMLAWRLVNIYAP